MWARIIEFILAMWLVLSPCAFYSVVQSKIFWISDLLCGLLIALFALCSFFKRLEKIHLCSFAIAIWLIGIGYFGSTEFPHPFTLQNNLIVGLLLAIVSIIPSHSSKPPRGWIEFYKNRMKGP